MNRLLIALVLVACTDEGDDGDDTPPVALAPLSPEVAPLPGKGLATPDRLTTWHWQTSGALDGEIDPDLWLIDALDTHAADVPGLHDRGASVFCPVHTSSVGPTGGADLPSDALGEVHHGDRRFIDPRHPDVHEELAFQLDAAVQGGCDGVALWGLDAHLQTTGFDATRDDQLGYARFLLNAAHERGLATMVTDAPSFAADLVDYADAALIQGCHHAETCDAYDVYEAAAKPRFVAESEGLALTDPALLCRTALIAGTRTIIVDPALDGSGRRSCDLDFPSTTRLADVQHYTTYYGRDPDALWATGLLDLAIVQPLLTSDQLLAMQTNAHVAVYLSIGEIGLSNTYLIDGTEQLGQVVYDAHPEWFLGKNPFFDSWFADTNQTGWQDFVLEQAALLLAQGYDGLFMDTVDTVDVYPDTIPGMVRLIERLRERFPDASLIQNRGMNVIPMSGPSVDALMFEVFSSTYSFTDAAYVPTDVTAPGYPQIVEKAVDYRLTGGVVLAQDFAEPDQGLDDLICYARERALRHRFVPSFADKFFQHGRYPYPARCPWPDPPPLKLALDPGVGHVSLGRTATIDVYNGTENPQPGTWTLTLGGTVPGVTASLPVDTMAQSTPAVIQLTASPTAPLGASRLPVHVGGETFDVPVVVHDETVWVTNAGLSNVVAFDEPSTLGLGTDAPDRVTGDIVAQPYAIAVAADGTQWVVENVGDPGAVQPAGRLLGYDRFDLTSPATEISTGLGYPTGVALDPSGRVWVTNSALDWTGTPRGTPNIAAIPDIGGMVTQMFRYDHASYGYPLALAFDDGGRVWVSTTYGLVLGFEAHTDAGVHPPFAVLAGAGGPGDPLFDTVRGLTFDASGTLWLTGAVAGTSRVVAVPSSAWTEGGAVSALGTSDASAVITAGLYGPWGLAFDGSGRLWVVNSTDADDDGDSRGSLVAFDPPTHGASASRTVPLASRYTLGIAVARP